MRTVSLQFLRDNLESRNISLERSIRKIFDSDLDGDDESREDLIKMGDGGVYGEIPYRSMLRLLETLT